MLDEVEEQLSFDPMVETTNRKPLRENPFAGWELRIGNLRVYYNVSDAPDMSVSVIAIGVKERNRVYVVSGEELEL